MRVFIPAEDGPFDAIVGPLVPYRYGLACERALRHVPPAMDELPACPASSAAIEQAASAGIASCSGVVGG